MISTDTCTFTREQKAMWEGDWTKIPMGMPGLETLMPLTYTRGRARRKTHARGDVHEAAARIRRRSWDCIRARARSRSAPTRTSRSSIRRRRTRSIQTTMETNADWSPYEGWDLAGFARTTLSRGEVIVDDYKVVGKEGRGQWLPRNDAPEPRARDAMTVRARERAGRYTPDFVTTAGRIMSAQSALESRSRADADPTRRTWSTYNIAALWIGMSVVITTYTLASGLMQQGMTWWQAMITILLGNTIVLDADDPERARRHEVRHFVSGAVPRELRRARRERAGDAARDRRVRVVRHSDVDRRRSRSTRCSTRRGRAGRSMPGSICDRVRDLLGDPGRDHRQGHSKASRCSRAGRRRCCSAAARCCCGGRSTTAAGSVTFSASRASCRNGTTPFWTLFPAALTANVGYWATLSLNIPDFTRYAQQPAIAGARPGARPADDDDGVRVHRRRGDERDDRDLRRGDLGSGRC